MIVLRSLSSLQRKGVALVALILLAESVTLSNAVKLWSNFQASYETLIDESARRSNQGECSTTNSDAHMGRQARSPLRFLPSFKGGIPRARPVDIADCCSKCSSCMEQARVLKCPATTIPRGGHSAVHHAAETLAEGVVKEAGVTPYGIPLHLWKIFFQAILTTINVACWLLPLRSKKISDNKLGLSLANAFSGGVFLSLAFGHLIPECVHGFHDYQESVPYMLVLAGYLLIFFVEKVAFDAHDILHEMEHGGTGHSHSHSHDNDKEQVLQNGGTENAPSTGRSAVILLGALAVHSVLEMMALGLADSFGESALLTMSIALHQVSRYGAKFAGLKVGDQ
jgi:ZIP Zinc transporter